MLSRNPETKKRQIKYQNKYTTENYIRRHILFSRTNPRDIAIMKALAELPNGSKNEFIKSAIEQALGLK